MSSTRSRASLDLDPQRVLKHEHSIARLQACPASLDLDPQRVLKPHVALGHEAGDARFTRSRPAEGTET